MRGEVFQRFLEALEPLRESGKLGAILFQLPPYVVFKPQSFEYLEWAREQLGDDAMLVEFRHRSWLEEDARAETLSFLERIGANYVTVDAPRSETAKNLVITAALRRRETALGKGSTIRDAIVYHHDASYANKGLDRLQAVTAADVQRVAKTYFGGKPVVITYTSGGAK